LFTGRELLLNGRQLSDREGDGVASFGRELRRDYLCGCGRLTYRAAVARWLAARITLRQGARVVE
jgi:hypothetical protein